MRSYSLVDDLFYKRFMLTPAEREKFLKLLRQPDANTFFLMILLSITQLFIAHSVDSFTFGFCIKVVCFGAPIAHLLYILSVDFASNLAFGYEYLDRISAILGNLCTGVPYAELLRFFESEHRAFYNSRLHTDPNKPNKFEIAHVHGVGLKLLYLSLYPLVFSHRLLFRHKISLTRFMSWNIVLQVIFNLVVWYFFGSITLLFLLCSTFVGMSPLHPCATHLLLEHQTVDHKIEKQITYSYYGIMNLWMCNAGYHREKHLEPKVPWSRIHLIRQLYYAEEKCNAFYTSILQSLHDFVFLEDIRLK